MREGTAARSRPLRPPSPRPESAARAPAGRRRRQLRHGVRRPDQRPGRELGQPREALPAPPPTHPADRSGLLGVDRRPRRARSARIDAGRRAWRIRPHAEDQRQRRPRSLARLLHRPPGRRRRDRRRGLRRERQDRRLPRRRSRDARPTSRRRSSGASASIPRPKSSTRPAAPSGSPKANHSGDCSGTREVSRFALAFRARGGDSISSSASSRPRSHNLEPSHSCRPNPNRPARRNAPARTVHPAERIAARSSPGRRCSRARSSASSSARRRCTWCSRSG